MFHQFHLNKNLYTLTEQSIYSSKAVAYDETCDYLFVMEHSVIYYLVIAILENITDMQVFASPYSRLM